MMARTMEMGLDEMEKQDCYIRRYHDLQYVHGICGIGSGITDHTEQSNR